MSMKFHKVDDINLIPKQDWVRVWYGDPSPICQVCCYNVVCYNGAWHLCSNNGSEVPRDLKQISDSEFFDIVSSQTSYGIFYFHGPDTLCYW